jgi:hypothetical protein
MHAINSSKKSQDERKIEINNWKSYLIESWEAFAINPTIKIK